MNKNKKAETRMVVRGGAYSSLIKSSLGKKNNKIKAFSVAEAAIALLIGAIVLGMSAPMISRQIKFNNASDVQISVLLRQVDELRRECSELRSQVQGMSTKLVQSGTIAFFNSTRCPDGWTVVDDSFNGRFPRFSGNYNICDKSGENPDGTCVGAVASSVTSNAVSLMRGDAIRNVVDSFNVTLRNDYEGFRNTITDDSGVFTSPWQSDIWTIAGGNGLLSNYEVNMDLSKELPVSNEIQPKSISLLGCKKD